MTARGTGGRDSEVTDREVGAPRSRREPGDPPDVPGYTLVRVLGRGGMGIVWEAREHRLDRMVALKVQAESRDPARVAQLWGEARLAAKVADPGIVPVHDFGFTVEGDPFFTMDLVAGTDLRALLRDAPLPRARALDLAWQIASAVGAAHDHGIVHRDLKPSNVLVDASGRARVVDFGLAYDPTLGDVYAHAMAAARPRTWRPSRSRAPRSRRRADVHAIGVMLYEMMTGARPWGTGDSEALLRRIAADPPVPPSQHNPGIGPDVEEVCLQCLAKAPGDRFANARALADRLDALRLGKSGPPPSLRTPARVADADRASTPPNSELPERDRAPVHRRWSWVLQSTPDELWPLVSHTDRVNRAIGLQAVDFTDVVEEGVGVARSGSFHLLGMNVERREYPFEWVRGQYHSVFRRYTKGPIEAVWNSVRLAPTRLGGTELVHEVWVKPRGIVGRLATFVEVDQKTAKNLDRLYKRIDECLVEGKGVDPFEPKASPAPDQRRQVEGAARRLVAGGFDQELVSRLCLFVLLEPLKRLERMRPFELADAWGVDRDGMLDLCLHAAYAGMLELSWDAICPRCRVPHESFGSLARIGPSTTCTPCGTSYERDLAASVEIVFRPHPAIRPATPTTYCVGAPALRPHVLVQQRLAAGERRTVTLDLAPGDYRLAGDWPLRAADLAASGAGFLDQCDVVVRESALDVRPTVLRDGPVELRLVNETAREQVVRLEAQGRETSGVTASVVMTHPSFRELFSDALLSETDPIAVRRMSFLCLEVDGRAKLFAERGDAGAWAALRRLDAIVEKALRAHRGSAGARAAGRLRGGLQRERRCARRGPRGAGRLGRGRAERAPGVDPRGPLHRGLAGAARRVLRQDGAPGPRAPEGREPGRDRGVGRRLLRARGGGEGPREAPRDGGHALGGRSLRGHADRAPRPRPCGRPGRGAGVSDALISGAPTCRRGTWPVPLCTWTSTANW